MPEHEDPASQRDADPVEEFVAVAYARDGDQAEHLAELLSDHEIPAEVDENASGGQSTCGVAILIPAEMLEEATDVIDQYEEMDDVIAAGDEYDEDDEEEIEEVDIEDMADLYQEEEQKDARFHHFYLT